MKFKKILIEKLNKKEILLNIEQSSIRPSTNKPGQLIYIKKFFVYEPKHLDKIKDNDFNNVMELPIKKIIITQDNVVKSEVINHLTGDFKNDKKEWLPKVIFDKNKYYLIDEHHRLIALYFMNESKIKVQMKKL